MCHQRFESRADFFSTGLTQTISLFGPSWGARSTTLVGHTGLNGNMPSSPSLSMWWKTNRVQGEHQQIQVRFQVKCLLVIHILPILETVGGLVDGPNSSTTTFGHRVKCLAFTIPGHWRAKLVFVRTVTNFWSARPVSPPTLPRLRMGTHIHNFSIGNLLEGSSVAWIVRCCCKQ